MAEKTEIIINDTWKIVHIDSMNWQVHQKREVKESPDPTKNKRVGEFAWMPMPAFFAKVDAAAQYVYDHMGDGAGRKTLREFMRLMEKSRDEITKAVGK